MLIQFEPQPRGTPVLVTHKGPNGERFVYHAVEECGGYEAEFYHCPAGDPVGVVKLDDAWFWIAEPTSPEFDADGYPTDATCEAVERWDWHDCGGLMEFVKAAWHLPSWGWVDKHDGTISVHTGGWSGNEDLISAMQSNQMFWSLCWQRSSRGGHYEFEIPKWSRIPDGVEHSEFH